MKLNLPVFTVLAIVGAIVLAPAHDAPGATISVSVPGTSDPWLAGMPDGSTASGNDRAPAQSPVLVAGLVLDPGIALSFTPAGAVGNYAPIPTTYPPEGNLQHIPAHGAEAENGIASAILPMNSLVGLFLGPDQPSLSAPPVQLDFGTQASRDYLSLRPSLKQVFFIGDGRTSDGRIQVVIPPPGATRLFLGTMDEWTWSDNIGAFSVSVIETNAPTTTYPMLSIGSTNDLWDISRGVTVVQHSPLSHADGSPNASDARDILGGGFGNYLPQRGATVFVDYMPSGFVHFVEWRTPEPVTIRSFSLFAAHDGDERSREFFESREFDRFRLKAKSPGSATFDVTLFNYEPSHPYTYSSESTFLLLSSDVRTITAQDFRAEFVNRTGVTYDGPRIIEIDGFDQRIGTQSGIRVSEVELCWNAGEGILYQIEYRADLPGAPWLSLGSAIAGAGQRMCITDKVTADAPRKFYRVRALD